MFHPEPLSLLLSTLALWLCVRTFSDPRWAWALGVTLGAAQLVRAWALVTVGGRGCSRCSPGGAGGSSRSCSSLAALIPAPWYIHQRVKYGGQPQFTAAARRPGTSLAARRSTSTPGSPGSSRSPCASITTRSGSRRPTTGSGATTSASGRWHSGTPSAGTTPCQPSAAPRHLELQSLLGLVPTLLALVGWALLASRVVARPAGLAVALLPPLGDRRLPLLRGRLLVARRRPAQGDLHAHGHRRLGDRLRLRARPAPRPPVAGDARRCSASALWPSCRSCSTSRLAGLEHVLEEAVEPAASAPSRARPRCGAGRRRSPSGRTAG